ncbi:MAG: hypothetical protein GX891_03490 [Clostridiales bacterium]|nr:hypothetical protein [Clostridiales bacterium]
MKRKRNKAILITILYALITAVMVFGAPAVAAAGEATIGDAVGEGLDSLDLKEFDAFIKSLGEKERSVLGFSSVKTFLRVLCDGNSGNFLGNFVNALKTTALEYIGICIPSFLTIIVVCILCSILSALTSNFKKQSTVEVVMFVAYATAVIIVLAIVTDVVITVEKTISLLSKLSEILFPILLTLLTALGGVTTVAAFQPFLAFLSGGIMKIISAIIVPAFVATNLFAVVGNITKDVKLDKMSAFFKSGASWLLGIVFSLFMAFVTAQGITGAAFDGISFQAAKFALSTYVPILGGYLSDGFDLALAGAVLIKNAAGFTGIIILLAIVVFPLLKLVILTLLLKLTAAVTEPLGEKKVSQMTLSVSKNMSLLAASLIGAGFLILVMFMLILGSCNVAA